MLHEDPTNDTRGTDLDQCERLGILRVSWPGITCVAKRRPEVERTGDALTTLW